VLLSQLDTHVKFQEPTSVYCCLVLKLCIMNVKNLQFKHRVKDDGNLHM
jgi:hypothetical protein